MNLSPLKLFATTPKGLELLLVDELRNLGATDPAEKLAGVAFNGDLALAYKACLWSRLANRILLTLAHVPAASPEELYAGVQSIDWQAHFGIENTFSVHFVSSQSNITHTLFGAQKVKDAIVDQFREKTGERPTVARDCPDVSVYVYLYRNQAAISLDLSGESLHRRGYRLSTGSAPLKENLAAAILLRAGWPALAKEQKALLDPMCGSGTLLIEAALIAANRAPGLHREYFGFLGWKQHQPKLWEKILNEAKQAEIQDAKLLPTIVGYDHDAEAIKVAFENIERAALLGKIHVEKRELAEFAPKAKEQAGLVVVNPPYGERLGEVEELQPLYTLLGERLKTAFEGWKAAVFTGNPDLGKTMGLRAQRYYALFNGAIPCKLFLFDVAAQYFVDRSDEANNERTIRTALKNITAHDKEHVQMFVNRLRKNLRHLSKEAKRNNQTTYRVYDADLPEYAFAIDVEKNAVRVYEYAPPKSVDAEKALHRRQAVLSVLPEELTISPRQVYFTVLPPRR